MTGITTEQQQRLAAAALDSRHRAYAPYSNFFVGAAVLTEQGAIFEGCNIENASFGLTICAERAAIFAAIAAGDQQLMALAVATDGGYSPCGACRQVMAEFCDDLQVLLVDSADSSRIVQTRLDELLPLRFS
jgi:cytidine deaminase